MLGTVGELPLLLPVLGSPGTPGLGSWLLVDKDLKADTQQFVSKVVLLKAKVYSSDGRVGCQGRSALKTKYTHS